MSTDAFAPEDASASSSESQQQQQTVVASPAAVASAAATPSSSSAPSSESASTTTSSPSTTIEDSDPTSQQQLSTETDAESDSDSSVSTVSASSSSSTASTDSSSTSTTTSASTDEDHLTSSSSASSGTLTASSIAAIAASLSSASSVSATPAPVQAPAPAPPLPPAPVPSPPPPAPTPLSSTSAPSNQRLVYPALHLFPLNGTFLPKCINLSPPGPHNRVKIGRQTTPKTAPNQTNGFFDSKVLSRAHAEIWSRDGKIFIKDVKSSNGTFINGERLSLEAQESDDFELHSEDHVEFGIDIVSEDGKVVLHHKVASRVYVVITAEDAVNIRHDIANGIVPSGGAGNVSAGARGGAGAGGAGANGGAGDLSGAGARRGPGAAGAGKANMINFDQVLGRLQAELKKSREAGQELSSITNVFSDIHDTLAGGMPPLQQPPYQHLVPEAEDRARPNPGSRPKGEAGDGLNSNNAASGDAAASVADGTNESSAAVAAATAAATAAAAAATKAKEEAEAKLAQTTQQASEQTQTVLTLQAQLSETQASLAEHIAKMRGLEEMLNEHEHLKGEVEALRRLVADVSPPASSGGGKERDGFYHHSAGSHVRELPPPLGRIPPPPLPPLPADAPAPSSTLFNSTQPLPPASASSASASAEGTASSTGETNAEPELELFDAFKARTSRKLSPSQRAEEEERMRLLDLREEEQRRQREGGHQQDGEDDEGRRTNKRSLSGSPPPPGASSAEAGGGLGPWGAFGLPSPYGESSGSEGGAKRKNGALGGEDDDDAASVADTVVPGSPPSSGYGGSNGASRHLTLGDAPKPPAGMDEVDGDDFGRGSSSGGQGSLGVPMRRRREESSPGLLQLAGADDASHSRWGSMRVRDLGPGGHRFGGVGGADEDEEDDEDEDEDVRRAGSLRKNGHVGPLAPPDMPPGLSYDGLDDSDHASPSSSWSSAANSRMTRAQLLEENAKLQARLATLEELLSEAMALGRSLARDVPAGADLDEDEAAAEEEAVAIVSDEKDASEKESQKSASVDDDEPEGLKQSGVKAEPVERKLPKAGVIKAQAETSSKSLDTSSSSSYLSGDIDVDAYVRKLESRISTLESEMDRRVAEVESEILRETQAKWELWRSQVEQGMVLQIQRGGWEADHGRIFRNVVTGRKGAGGVSAGAGGGAGADEEEDEDRSARSASSGDTDGSTGAGSTNSTTSTNATSPPSSIAESVGRIGRSLLGGATSPGAGSMSSSAGQLGKGEIGAGSNEHGVDEVGGGSAADGKQRDGPARGRGPTSKPFLFSDNSAAVPALSAAGAVIVAMAVMAFAAKSAGPHK
ncbi:hypothetical protein OC846_005453 [Tilletia horrida]|uniref:FHA domain-containing protein n=1 Tax=Tilletia horrida TaxID=155126 RepID=A0AAN6GNI1_9BASI|nr:hypothetical protein OC846_005453 [Tilletia horrida]KAK0561056.1 hypothetical protein OC861_006005 [Tilletia horrida]